MTLESVVRRFLAKSPSFREDYPYTAKLMYEALGEEPPEYVSTQYLPKDTERFEFVNGWARVHAAHVCDGHPCPIHEPSEHKMRGWPMLLRETGLVERICPHGTGHPDPDSLAYFIRVTGDESWEVHGCHSRIANDGVGCCVG